jgi:hypothetical protein
MISPDELLIFSGCLSGGFSGGPCPSSDSWIFSYSRNRWDKVDSSCISPRLFSAMTSLVSDGFRQSAVMFSGLEKDKTILKVFIEFMYIFCLKHFLTKRKFLKRPTMKKRTKYLCMTVLLENGLEKEFK